MDSFDPRHSNVLPNGAEILRRCELQDGRWLWLAYFKGHLHPYVTWFSNADNPGDTYWGTYRETIVRAELDWYERREQNTVFP